MKQIRSSNLYKGLCILLTCLFFGAAVTVCTAGIIELLELPVSTGRYFTGLYGDDYLASSYLSHEYLYTVSQQYSLALKEAMGEKLNSAQKKQRDKANETLRPENTNFRYRILDLEGKTLYSSLSGAEDLSQSASKRYYSALSGDSADSLYYSQGYLSAYSLDNGDLNDYLNNWFVYDAEKDVYYSRDESEDYAYQMEVYQSHLEDVAQAADTPSSSSPGSTTLKRMELDGYFDDDGNFWHYSHTRDTFLKLEHRWEGEEESIIVYRDDETGDWMQAMSYMDEQGTVFYFVNDSYSESMEHFYVNGEDAVDDPEPEPAPEVMPPPEDNRRPLTAIVEWGIADAVREGKGVQDEFQSLYWQNLSFESHLPWYIGLTAAFAVLCLVTLVMLLCAVGHTKESDKPVLSVVHKAPADVLLFVLGGIVSMGVWLGAEAADYFYENMMSHDLADGFLTLSQRFTGQAVPLYEIIFFTAAAAMLLTVPFLTTVTAQLKTGCLVRRTLTAWCVLLAARICRWCWNGFWNLTKTVCRMLVSVAWFIPVGYLVFHLVLGLLTMQGRYDGMCLVLAMLLVGGGFVALCLWLVGWKRAQEAAKRLAEGDLLHRTDTDHLYFDMKAHVENLNSISTGMQKAVDQQLKSDRFRTELITNVSHDLKTPLTSIISYVDLLKKRDIQDEEARSYIDVLDQKSQRLKTLTEDLVEASKAATGVLTVNTERLDAGQLLRQAVGEYQERLDRANLTVVMDVPEEPVYVNADGRHLWRILDNVLSNCAKYAMSGTRVYAALERRDGTAVLSVKNISAEPLNIPADELMERFVRGDTSRTNEGSGLGLSIAQSLAALQGAKFRVSTDGDLFKAEVEVPGV